MALSTKRQRRELPCGYFAVGTLAARMLDRRDRARTTYGKMKKSAVVPSRTVHANVAGRYLVFTSHFGILHAPLRGPRLDELLMDRISASRKHGRVHWALGLFAIRTLRAEHGCAF